MFYSIIQTVKYSLSLLGYCFHYQNIMFSYLDRGENSPNRKKSNSKSPSRKISAQINDNTGDFSPLLSRANKSLTKNPPDFMTSSLTNLGNFTNPLIFQYDESSKRVLTAEQEILNKKYGIYSFFY